MLVTLAKNLGRFCLMLAFIAAFALLYGCNNDAYAAGHGVDPAKAGLGVDVDRAGLGLKVPAQAIAKPEYAAVSVQVTSSGRIAIVTLYDRPCSAPSTRGDNRLSDGHVVFDPPASLQAGADPGMEHQSVRLCWSMLDSSRIMVMLYKVTNGQERASDPILMHVSDFQVIDIGR